MAGAEGQPRAQHLDDRQLGPVGAGRRPSAPRRSPPHAAGRHAASSSSVRQDQPAPPASSGPGLRPALAAGRPCPAAPGGGYRRALMSSRAPAMNVSRDCAASVIARDSATAGSAWVPAPAASAAAAVLGPQPGGETGQAEPAGRGCRRQPAPAARIRATSSAHQPSGTVSRSRNRRRCAGGRRPAPRRRPVRPARSRRAQSPRRAAVARGQPVGGAADHGDPPVAAGPLAHPDQVPRDQVPGAGERAAGRDPVQHRAVA